MNKIQYEMKIAACILLHIILLTVRAPIVALMRYKPAWFITMLVMMTREAEGLTAYDCTHPNATQTPLSLLKPKSCVPRLEYYQDPMTIRIQLIQTESARPVTAYTCRISVTSQVTRCGFDSITYGSHYPVKDEMVDIDAPTCREAVASGKLSYEGQTVSVLPDEPKTFGYYRRGWVKPTGACSTEDFTLAGIHFRSSVELRTLRLSITTTRGVVNEGGTVVFQNGLRGPYQDSLIRDSKAGTMVWTLEDPKCHQRISEIYLGEATMFRHRNSSVDSIVLLADNKTNQFGGFLLKGTKSLCKQHVYTTQIPNLVVNTMRSGDSPIAHSAFKDTLEQTKVSIMSHLAYLHVRTNQDVTSQFAEVYENICKIDATALTNRLRMVAEDMTKTAVDVFGPGYAVVAAGEAAHVIHCIEVEVATRTLPNCTRALPISYGFNNSRLGFRDPITHQITDYSAPVPCDPVMPIMHQIEVNDRLGWYCITPDLTPCRAPMELDPTVEFTLSARDYGAELGHRLYAQWQEDAHRYAMFVHGSREGVLDTLGQRARDQGIGTPGHHWQPGMPLSGLQQQGLVTFIGNAISPLFSLIGNAIWYVWCGLVGISIVRILYDFILRCYWIAKAPNAGCCQVFGAFTHTLNILTLFPMATILAAARGPRHDSLKDSNEPRAHHRYDHLHELVPLQPEPPIVRHRVDQVYGAPADPAPEYQERVAPPHRHRDQSPPPPGELYGVGAGLRVPMVLAPEMMPAGGAIANAPAFTLAMQEALSSA